MRTFRFGQQNRQDFGFIKLGQRPNRGDAEFVVSHFGRLSQDRDGPPIADLSSAIATLARPGLAKSFRMLMSAWTTPAPRRATRTTA